jgi:hypothetical protein
MLNGRSVMIFRWLGLVTLVGSVGCSSTSVSNAPDGSVGGQDAPGGQSFDAAPAADAIATDAQPEASSDAPPDAPYSDSEAGPSSCRKYADCLTSGLFLALCVGPYDNFACFDAGTPTVCTQDSDCLLTDICTAGHCQARSCAQCLPQFGCTDAGCALTSCNTDAECPGGFCVNASCQPSPGGCKPGCV